MNSLYKIWISVVSLLMLTNISILAQEYPVENIPDSLKTNANAVVRYDETFFTQTDQNNGTVKYTYVVTVLEKAGREHADIVIPQDKYTELKSFSGIVQNPLTGKVIKKLSKSDLITIAYSSHFASDDKYSAYEYQPSVYPFTIKYEYELKCKNGIPSYPRFVPVTDYKLSVQQARYIIRLPANTKIRYKAVQMSGEPKIVQEAGSTVYEWNVENFPALTYESFSPSLLSLAPNVTVAPEEFCMDKHCGNMNDWRNLGSWLKGLQEGRENIPPQLQQKLTDMTKDAASDREKIEIIYKYLQTTTRYVSIQLGVGGFQPMPAESVAKSGFGDCKALTNYMKSMLAAVGIPSVYTIISTRMPNIYTDFASFTQMDHVILAVPQPKDTIWLECTSAQMPFNYAHSSMAGHQVVLVTDKGGEICRVKKHPEVSDNMSSRYEVVLDENGNAKANVYEMHKLEAYEDMISFMHTMSREEQINYLAGKNNFSKVKVSGIAITPNHSDTPDVQINYNLDIERFANKSGNRLFVPFAPLEFKIGSTLKEGKRKNDILIRSGMVQTDTLRVVIPANYTSESIPKSVSVDSPFGKYDIKTELGDNNTLQIIQHVYLKQGRYPASEYEKLRDFFKQITRESTRRAVFKVI